MRALGARPVRLPAEVPTVDGLQGIEHLIGAIYSNSLDIDGSHLLTNVDLWPAGQLVLVAGSRAYRRLSAGTAPNPAHGSRQRRAQSPHARAQHRGQGQRQHLPQGRSDLHAATSSELRALRLAVEPVSRDLERHPGTRAAIEAIERHKAELGEPPADLASCERAAGARPRTRPRCWTAVWRMDTTTAKPSTTSYCARTGRRWTYVFDRRQVRDHAGDRRRVHPGATGPSPSTATGCRGPLRTAAASPRPGLLPNPVSYF